MKRRQFHEYSQEEQSILANNYLKNMATLKAEGIGYVEQGTLRVIKTRTSRTVFKPHTGEWIMTTENGKRSGRDGKSLIRELRTIE